MKYKIVRIIGIIASIVTIIAAVLYFARRRMVPGLEPFSLSIMMICLVISSWKQFKDDKVSRTYFDIIAAIGLIACVLNIGVGIMQIVNTLMK